jgi:hypothetical protein
MKKVALALMIVLFATPSIAGTISIHKDSSGTPVVRQHGPRTKPIKQHQPRYQAPTVEGQPAQTTTSNYDHEYVQRERQRLEQSLSNARSRRLRASTGSTEQQIYEQRIQRIKRDMETLKSDPGQYQYEQKIRQMEQANKPKVIHDSGPRHGIAIDVETGNASPVLILP